MFQSIFELKEMLFYDVLLHFSTVLSVICLFFKDIVEYCKQPKIIFYIFILTLPTGIIGFLIKKYFYHVFDNVLFSGVCLLITAGWLILSEYRYLNQSNELRIELQDLGVWKTILVGTAQGVAVLPGISRSGATLGMMLLLNVERQNATKFVFISAIPSILAATGLEIQELAMSDVRLEITFIYGMILAFVFGILSLIILLNIVKKSKLKYFAYYCGIIGLLSILIYFLK